jgi:stearoyl-CoA desaturase (Delta-9 desaturase)
MATTKGKAELKMSAIAKTILSWFDSHSINPEDCTSEKIDWFKALPFVLIHFMVGLAYFSGVSITALAICFVSYFIRMFAITGFYHRYFSHKAFKTGRVMHSLFAFLGSSTTQRGPLWWASHHRRHHSHSDQEKDTHSPVVYSFLWSHMGWFLCRKNYPTDMRHVKDWEKYPELKFINRFDMFSPAIYIAILYGIGAFANAYFPNLNFDGFQSVVWGFIISTVILYHATFTINSLAHRWGSQRYDTNDQSRNNRFLAIITLGEGWHNNHHFYPSSARQGFFPGEWDVTYKILQIFKCFGLISDLKSNTPETIPISIKNNSSE